MRDDTEQRGFETSPAGNRSVMAAYTKKNLRSDVENQAPKFDMPSEMQTRFATGRRQRVAQFRRASGFGEARQRADHLDFSVVQRPKFVEIEILQRSETHGPP